MTGDGVDLLEAQSDVERWVERFVVGLNVCPFAGRELRSGRVRFSCNGVFEESELLSALQFELRFLLQNPAFETTLLIHPNVLTDFLAYNDFLDRAEALLEEMDLSGVFQIASFHPSYQFAGTEKHDAENFTNRSPHPLLHILREDSISRAIESHENIERIPVRNIEKMNSLGAAQLLKLFSE